LLVGLTTSQYTLSIILLVLTYNSPINAYWKLIKPRGTKCVDEGPALIAGGIIKTIIEIGVTTLPIPLIARMKIERKQRVAIVALLGLGYLTTAAGVVRTYYIWKTYYGTYDVVWYQYPGFIVSVVEVNLGIVSKQTEGYELHD
jgi:hypothetical protein